MKVRLHKTVRRYKMRSIKFSGSDNSIPKTSLAFFFLPFLPITKKQYLFMKMFFKHTDGYQHKINYFFFASKIGNIKIHYFFCGGNSEKREAEAQPGDEMANADSDAGQPGRAPTATKEEVAASR